MSHIPLTTAIYISVILAAVAAAFDKYFFSQRFAEWRSSVRTVWEDLKGPDVLVTVRDVQPVFLSFFEIVYGNRLFSWKRLWASIVSTTIALFVISFLLGWNHSFLSILIEDIVSENLILAIIPVCLNYVPDYFSLWETRFVLKRAKDKGMLGLCFLVVVDILLTTAIFILGIVIFVVARDEPLSLDIEFFVEESLSVFALILENREGEIVFYLTTFVTSLLWLFFVLTYISIRLLQKCTPLAFAIVDQFLALRKPATGMSILIILIFWAYVIVVDAGNSAL